VMERFRLDAKVAVVTGASSGLGVAFAVALAEAGADLVLGARRLDGLNSTKELVEAIGRRCLIRVTDVSRPDDCRRLVDSAMAEFGRVDVLVNNAGVGVAVPATRETPEQFRAVIDVNLNGSYWMAQACGRVMLPGSSIVNISSVLGLTTAGLPQAAYR
jgi:NAD(P)-dependent dehydrogenase (short-subunit alcohol dehydrogenase family)